MDLHFHLCEGGEIMTLLKSIKENVMRTRAELNAAITAGFDQTAALINAERDEVRNKLSVVQALVEGLQETVTSLQAKVAELENPNMEAELATLMSGFERVHAGINDIYVADPIPVPEPEPTPEPTPEPQPEPVPEPPPLQRRR